MCVSARDDAFFALLGPADQVIDQRLISSRKKIHKMVRACTPVLAIMKAGHSWIELANRLADWDARSPSEARC